MALILHITQRAAWDAARQTGSYPQPPIPSQGFIHCSRTDQVVRVADANFRGKPDLVLLCIDTSLLTATLDPAGLEEGEADFPHIHGQINLDAVVAVLDFSPGADGLFALPESLCGLDT